MKVKMSVQEWWPVYVIDETGDVEVDLPPDVVERAKKWLAEYEDLRMMLYDAWEAAPDHY